MKATGRWDYCSRTIVLKKEGARRMRALLPLYALPLPYAGHYWLSIGCHRGKEFAGDPPFISLGQ